MKKLYLMPLAAVSVLSDEDICTLSTGAEGNAMEFIVDQTQFS